MTVAGVITNPGGAPRRRRWQSFKDWLAKSQNSVTARVAAVHVIALIGLATLWFAGVLQPVFAGGGVFAWLILALALAAAGAGVFAAWKLETTADIPRARNAVTWLEWAENALLILGFLGTLQGAIIELTNLDPAAKGEALLVMLRGVIRGVGIAIYTTLAGAAAAFWAGIATRLLNNTVETAAEADPGAVLDESEFRKSYGPWPTMRPAGDAAVLALPVRVATNKDE